MKTPLPVVHITLSEEQKNKIENALNGEGRVQARFQILDAIQGEMNLDSRGSEWRYLELKIFNECTPYIFRKEVILNPLLCKQIIFEEHEFILSDGELLRIRLL